MIKYTIILFSITICICNAYGQVSSNILDQPKELGLVHWIRDYDQALALSKAKELPVFIFFQEVPGCHTCTTFGSEIMSHPDIVKAIESHFVPLAIYNNKGGKDAKVLKKYKEPSWNNPVIRIVDDKGMDIVQRHASAYQLIQVIETIQKGLLASNQLQLTYLDELSRDLLKR